MRTFQTLALALGLLCPLAIVGCTDEVKEKDTKVITGPEGTSKITKETKVESSGSNPPIDIKENNSTAPNPAPDGVPR